MPAMGHCQLGSRARYPQRRSTVRGAKSMSKMRKTAPLPATNSTPRPGDFPLGSVESRAAARMLAGKREDTKKRIEVRTNVSRYTWMGDDPMPEDWGAQLRATPWNDCGD